MKTSGYIYGLFCTCQGCDPSEIRYVGQTRRKPETRLQAHVAQTESRRPITRWVHKHGARHIEMTILEQRVPLDQLNSREKFWINQKNTFQGFNPRGLNFTKGGTSRELDSDEQALADAYRLKDPTHRVKLTWDAVTDIRRRYSETADPVKEISEDHGIVEGTAYAIIMNNSWHDPNYTYRRRSKKGTNTGESAWTSKLTWEDVGRIREQYLAGVEQAQIAEEFSISAGVVNRVARNRTWIDPAYTPPKPKSVSSATNRRNARLTMEEAQQVREDYATGNYLQRDLMEKFGVSLSVIRGIVQGKTYREDSK